MGFSIQEDFGNKYDTISKSLKKSKDKTYVVWIDEFEGGKAYQDDWTYVDEFTSHEGALQYIEDNYGEVEKSAVY
jgi:hypothetical protein